MSKWLLHLRDSLTDMHIDGDMRFFLTEAQWTVVKNLTILVRPFIIVQSWLKARYM